MITLTGFVYHEERPVFLCPLYHPCVIDEWNEKSNIKSGWISISPSSSTNHSSSAASASPSSSPVSTSHSFPPPSISSIGETNTTPSLSLLLQSPSLSLSSSPPPPIQSSSLPVISCTTEAPVDKKSQTCLPSPFSTSLTGIHFRFEVDRWALVKYDLTLYQLIYVFKEICRSKNFRKSIVRRELIPIECRQSIRTLIRRGANIDLFVRFKVNDCQSSPIDWFGNLLFLALVTTKLRIDETLSILSTLGGAYSSLGEHYLHFAIKAGETSIKQIGLACITADPTIIARCSIYMVYSLCQRGLRKRAHRLMIEFIHPYINKMIIKKTCDNIVRNMYKAAKFRVEHYYNGNC